MGVRYIFGQDGAFRTEPVIVAKNITENGTYDPATEGADGYAPVTVNVEGGGSSWQTVFDGSVTTSGSETAEGTINYSEQISADTIKVTFNGTEYECPKINTPFGGVAYGGIGEQGYDFSEYPFVIMSGEGTEQTIVNTLVTPTPNTYTLKIEEEQSGGSSDFSTAEVTLNLTVENATLVETSLETLIIYYPSEDFSYSANHIPSINNICPVLLYQGYTTAEGVLAVDNNEVEYSSIVGTPVTTGGVSWDADQRMFEITGDGTITATLSLE